MMPGAESLNAAVASSVCMWEQFGRTVLIDKKQR
jgi:tRNA G18 (ribose-2'-O)-methylase SpoU